MIGATLNVLVEKMTPHDSMVGLDLWETFFLTFRLFTTPESLLEALKLRYDLLAPQQMPMTPATIRLWNERKVMPVRLRIFNFLKTWLESYWCSESDDPIFDALVLFIKERISRSFPVESPRLLDLVKKTRSLEASVAIGHSALGPMLSFDRSKHGSPTSPLYGNAFFNTSATTALPPTPIMNKQLFNNLRTGQTSINITDFHALELARQLTLMESSLYCAITPEDLLHSGKKKVASLKGHEHAFQPHHRLGGRQHS